jgi:cation diffusion facilitator CzcD-associated flavoprotein CzcO
MLTLVRDYEDLNVALIGVGSSAIQILPHLQKKCKDVHLLARGGRGLVSRLAGVRRSKLFLGIKTRGIV